MALEINRAPILTGKAAEDFWKSVESFKGKETKEEIQENLRRYREFMAKQTHLKPYYV